MSLYNMLHGEYANAEILLKILGLNKNDIPRYRDCFLDKNLIVIHTRTGGGNRDYYESLECCKENYPEYFEGEDIPSGPWNSDLQSHNLYLTDSDDDYDSTYANFYFKVPDEFSDDIKQINDDGGVNVPSDKWKLLFKKIDEMNQEVVK